MAQHWDQRRSDGAELERIFRLTMGAGLVVFAVLLANTYRDPTEAGGRAAAITGLIVCAATFVPWSRLPFLGDRIVHPTPFVSVVTKLLLATSVGALPVLVGKGHWLVAAGALALALACVGLWFRWTPVVWLWYVLLAAGLVLGVRELWYDVLGERSSAVAAFDLALRLPGFLIWIAFLTELIRWHRTLHGEHQRAAAASPEPGSEPRPETGTTSASAPPAGSPPLVERPEPLRGDGASPPSPGAP